MEKTVNCDKSIRVCQRSLAKTWSDRQCEERREPTAPSAMQSNIHSATDTVRRSSSNEAVSQIDSGGRFMRLG
jgi:hypothetical protein